MKFPKGSVECVASSSKLTALQRKLSHAETIKGKLNSFINIGIDVTGTYKFVVFVGTPVRKPINGSVQKVYLMK